MFLLESPLKAQGLAMEEITEHIPCGPTSQQGSICIHGLGGQVYDRHGHALGYRFRHTLVE
jgi:hypothetical protein